MTVHVHVLASAICVFSSITVHPARRLCDIRQNMKESFDIEKKELFIAFNSVRHRVH
jgi:hypothetical protein